MSTRLPGVLDSPDDVILPLEPTRIPAWHPTCSGLHRAGRVMLRMGSGGLPRKRATLVGLDARLWCLCGGQLSETELAATVSVEERLPLREARRRVARFLERLYQGGFLVARSADHAVPTEAREAEGRTDLGEVTWSRLTG